MRIENQQNLRMCHAFDTLGEHSPHCRAKIARRAACLLRACGTPGAVNDAQAWSSSNALCSARTASSMYFSSISTEILISDVEIN
ncbi:hypothetical protein PCE31106_01717 [Pandoraea cepalis]|uniref:Uncharacterized protein n=1 Tax=Pandoraea cepalis TaxID=2508294 RepID=A0A5E4U2K5_9BURK|nr:hypothetical protein PCE31106_01717 [Pandoraea cepalis]